LCYLLAALVGAEVILVALMYAIEIPTGNILLFGPLSDIAGLVGGFLIAPLVWALSRPSLTTFPWRVLTWAVIGVSIVAATGTALMIVDVAPFGVSTGISVASYLMLTVWLLVLARRWRSPGVTNSLVRLSRLIAWASLVGAAVAGSSLAFGWGTTPQVAIMIIGLVPGGAAYASWPAWFTQLGRNLCRAPRSGSMRPFRLTECLDGCGSQGERFCCVVGKSDCNRTRVRVVWWHGGRGG
jgi:hypothetical protein